MLDLPQILIVDPQPQTGTELAQNLRRAGFSIDLASDGLEALDRFNSLKYSMVILDDKAPGSGSLDMLDAVKKISPETPVAVMTANGTVHKAVAAMQAGACDYILKPFSAEVLEKTVKRALAFSAGKGAARPGIEGNSFNSDGKEIITCNAELLAILKQAKSIAPSKATVLIQGESGTGKELLAAYIHRYGLHPKEPYVALNCAALPETLAESELFGHEKGSFTGAVGRKIGKFELAKNGTVVLDEISEMPLPLQAKLLRVLQEKEIDRIGGTRPIPIDARVIAISNVNLKKAVADGKFREDLYYRIHVIPLTLPPLRQRRDDIVLLAKHFLEKYSRLNRKKIAGLSDAAVKVLLSHPWNGNVRELENTIERAVLISNGGQILAQDLLMEASADGTGPVAEPALKVGITVRDMEKNLIFRTLEEVNDNRTQAAELLGISIRTLRNKLREYREESAAGGGQRA